VNLALGRTSLAMRRIIITIVILLIAVGVVGGVVVAYSFLCKGPSIQITGDSHKKEFFVTFLGEYCDSLSNVTLTDVRTNVVVWDVDIKPGVAFCNFSLSLRTHSTVL
jgi:hypothetical protein